MSLRRVSSILALMLSLAAAPSLAQCGENFDAVTPPAFPAGWVVTTAIDCANSNPWATVAAGADTAPNAATVTDPNCISDERLDSPAFPINSAAAVLTIRRNNNLETGFDGTVLEVSVNGGAYQDVLAAGGLFGVGGYNGVISVNFGNPLAGRSAWTGNSGGFVTTTVNLPASANGQTWAFRFRRGTDSSVSGVSFTLDTLSITGCVACSITCPANVTASNDPNQCGAVQNYPAPITGGSCGTVICSPASGSFFPVGTTTVTCTTAAGPSCSFTETIQDTQPPTETAPDLVVNTDPGVCTGTATPAATAADNCPGVTSVCTPPGPTFPLGLTPVSCTATDGAGNTATDTGGSVTVNDLEPPVIACPADIVEDLPPGADSGPANWSDPVVSDNCPSVGLPTCVPPSGSIFQADVLTPVSCTVQDAAANSAACTFTVLLGFVSILEIPTVSGWGLAGLALLLAGSAFLALRRRKA